MGWGHGANGAPFFSVCFLFIKPSMLLSTRYCKTRRYTNVICCEVKTCIQSKTPAQVQRQILSGANAVLRSFFLSCFSSPRFVAWPSELGLGTLNPRFVVWPLELGLGTRNPRFVAAQMLLPTGASSGSRAGPSTLGTPRQGNEKETRKIRLPLH